MSIFEYNNENRDKIIKVSEFLEGSCKSLEDGLEAVFGDDVGLDDLDIELLRLLDDLVLECEGCGWWCPAEDLNEDQVCHTCE